MAGHLERLDRGRRVFLLEQRLVLKLRDLEAPPHDLLDVEFVQTLVLALLVAHDEAGRHRPTVLVLPEPRHEDSDEVALAALGLLPALVELAAHAVSRGLQNDLGARQIGNGLDDAGKVSRRVRPERHLGAVE